MASILNTNGLDELVTEDLKDYENLAVNLGLNHTNFIKLKKKVKEKSSKSTLFDNTKFTKNLENIYTDILKS